MLGLGLLLLAGSAAAGNVLQFCEDERGQLRLPRESGGCEGDEAPLSWQRHGGVRLFDAGGNDLGRILPWRWSSLVWNDHSDVAYLIDGNGAIAHFTFAYQVFFDEPDCRGNAVVAGDPPVGLLVPDRRTAGELFVVSDRDVTSFVAASRFSSRCEPRSFAPFQSMALEPFAADPGVGFPVATPLRVATGLPPDGETGAIVHVCSGPSGALRRVADGAQCRGRERPDAWLRLGGPRLFDGEGQELGLLLERDFVYHADADVEFRLNWLDGQLSPLPRPTLFSGRHCTGEAVVEDFFLGRLFPSGDPSHPLSVARGPLQASARIHSFRYASGVCVNSSAGGFLQEDVVGVEPFAGDLGYEFPVALPVAAGFPGSPLVDPGGSAPGTGVFHACVAPSGRLRAADDVGGCRSQESPLAWERRGGLRVLDAKGSDLGTLTPESAALDDASGLRFGLDFRTATFDEEATSTLLRDIFFEELECRGRIFVDRPWSGLVVERAVVPPGFFAGTRRLVSGLRSRSIVRGGRCIVTAQTVPLGVELEPLSELPFALPLAAPLRIAPALP